MLAAAEGDWHHLWHLLYAGAFAHCASWLVKLTSGTHGTPGNSGPLGANGPPGPD